MFGKSPIQIGGQGALFGQRIPPHWRPLGISASKEKHGSKSPIPQDPHVP